MTHHPPISTLFPYTTLFRSPQQGENIMKYLRNLILAGGMALGMALSFTGAPTAQANPPKVQHHGHHVHHHHPHSRIYYVYYRTSPASPWVCYGGYNHSAPAAQAVAYLPRCRYA